jgi:aspartate-semialdehyde dehydrogenase
MMTGISVAIVGATGLAGQMLLRLFEERHFPLNNLYLLASEQSVGLNFEVQGKSITVSHLADFDFSKAQITFFCVGNDIAKQYIPKATAKGSVVIDKSSFYRDDPLVPLIIPEVNPEHIKLFRHKNIIANPNCSMTPIAMVLKPLADAAGIDSVEAATYQSVSGSGKDAVQELLTQTQRLLQGESVEPKVYPQQIAFNVLPQIDLLQANGFCKEEMKIVKELQKVLGDETLVVNPTTVRVPVLYGHGVAIHVKTKQALSLEKARSLLANAPGIQLIDGADYPTPAIHAQGKDAVYVGRIRKQLFADNGLNMWAVTDNLRKGAALNACQIAELLIGEKLI